MKTEKRLVGAFIVLSLVIGLMIPLNTAKADEFTEIYAKVTFGQKEAHDMLGLINNMRATEPDTNSTEPYVIDYILERAAMQRAAEIAFYFEDVRPDGSDYTTALTDYGFEFSGRGPLVGQNLVAGEGERMTAEGAIQEWKGNELTRRNLLGNYAAVGIGHVMVDDGDYWVILFSTKVEDPNPIPENNSEESVKIRFKNSMITGANLVTYAAPTVAVGSYIDLPDYTGEVTIANRFMDKPLIATGIGPFKGDDTYVSVSNGKIYGLSQGTGTVTATVGSQVFSCNVTVTGGNGNTATPTPLPTSTPTPTLLPTSTATPTPLPTSTATPTPRPTNTVTQAPNPTTTVVTQAPSPTTTIVTQAPSPTTTVVTQAPNPTTTIVTQAPNPTTTIVTQAPSPTTTVVTQAPSPVDTVVTQAPEPINTVTQAPTPTTVVTENNDNKDNNNTVDSLVGTKFTYKKNVYVILDKKTVSFVSTKNTTATKLTIPNTVKYKGTTYKVTKIEASALKGNKSIKKLIIGTDVKTIGKKAFYNCSKLKNITIKGTNITSIGKSSFAKIYKKAVITVPASVKDKYEKKIIDSGIGSKVKVKS
ncbi:MAG: leucine-rich repeat protein [Lachnospiraceae bacterium]|nr:leucine-rich repeat protein [Lachnospiraceae bacterium]